jgi:hypothetical protein
MRAADLAVALEAQAELAERQGQAGPEVKGARAVPVAPISRR